MLVHLVVGERKHVNLRALAFEFFRLFFDCGRTKCGFYLVDWITKIYPIDFARLEIYDDSAATMGRFSSRLRRRVSRKNAVKNGECENRKN